MIFGGLGLTLNILTIAILSFSFTLLVSSLLIISFEGLLSRFDAKSRSRLLWCTITLPWLVSLISVAVLVFPELFSWREVWLTSMLHWHHIYAFPVISWHGASLLLFSLLCFFLLLTKLVKVLKIKSSLNQLNDFLKPEALPSGCMLIESMSISAFTSGFIKPKAYITRGLYDQLRKEENCVVQQHELAHAKYAHPLKKYVFSLFASFYPMYLVRKLNDFYALALEQLADDDVLENLPDVTLVSKTIIRVTRLQGAISASHRELMANCAFTALPLELRIRYLLNDNKGCAFPYLFVCISALTVAAISTLSVDYIHHTFEHLFSH